jgi:nucleoid-associated protein YgaU
MIRMTRRRLRCALVWLAATVAAGSLMLLLGPSALGPLPRRFDALLVRAAVWALAACVAWAWLTTTAVVGEALRATGRDAQPTATRAAMPGALRRLVLLACGVVIAGGVTAPALASTSTAHAPAHAPAHAATVGPVFGLPLPQAPVAPQELAHVARTHSERHHRPDDRPSGRPRTEPARPTAGTADGPHVRVRPGDTLWAIAERQLGSEASISSIATAAQTIYRHNRGLIGSDPDRIEPGQVLDVPARLVDGAR